MSNEQIDVKTEDDGRNKVFKRCAEEVVMMNMLRITVGYHHTLLEWPCVLSSVCIRPPRKFNSVSEII